MTHVADESTATKLISGLQERPLVLMERQDWAEEKSCRFHPDHSEEFN